MAKKPNKFVSIANGVMSFGQPGNYTMDFAGNSVTVNRGSSMIFTDAQLAAVTDFDFGNINKLHLKGISFAEADETANFRFEPDTNLNVLINDLLHTYGVAGTLDRLTVNGGIADAFKLIWDFLDDGYTYYDLARAQAFIELGVEYVEYLRAGGAALTDVVAKYAPDDGDANTTPERLQSLHDNLLGNLNTVAIIDRFFDGVSQNGEPTGSSPAPNESLGMQYLQLVGALGFNDRPYYGGYDQPTGPQLSDNAGPTILWDQQAGLLPL